MATGVQEFLEMNKIHHLPGWSVVSGNQVQPRAPIRFLVWEPIKPESVIKRSKVGPSILNL